MSRPISEMPEKGKFIIDVWIGHWENPRAFGMFSQVVENNGKEGNWATKTNFDTTRFGACEVAGWRPLELDGEEIEVPEELIDEDTELNQIMDERSDEQGIPVDVKKL